MAWGDRARGAVWRGGVVALLALAVLAVACDQSGASAGIDLGAGQLLAFIGGNGNLWMAKADGSSAHAVTTTACAANVNCFGPPAWSPDGALVAVIGPATGGAGSQIDLYTRLGLLQRTIAPPNAATLGPEPILWSADGQTLAFEDIASSGGAPQLSIILIAAASGAQTGTVPLPAPSGAQCGDSSPGGPFGSAVDRAINGSGGLRDTFAWSHDGGTFLVATGPCQTQVAIVPRAGTTRILGPITPGGVPLQAAFAPDGQHIVADQLTANQDDLVVYDAAGAHGRSIFTETAPPQPFAARIAAPAWSADGKTVYFMRGTDLWAVGADGSNPRRLVAGAASGAPLIVVAAPTPAPDGTRLAWATVSYAPDENIPRTALLVGNADGSHPQLVAQGGLWPAWS